MVSEYGGAFYQPDINGRGFGYGTPPESEQAFIDRFVSLTTVLLENPFICGFCYTQLYDVEQEQNGFYTQSREPKFSPRAMEHFFKALTQKASVEAEP